MKNKWLLITVIALLLTTTFFVVSYGQTEKAAEKKEDLIKIWELNKVENSNGSPNQGYQSPEFSFINNNGEKAKLSDLKGNVIFLNFWASWCPSCKKEMPAIQNIYNKYKDENVKFITVNIQENTNTIKNFMKDHNFSFPVIKDPGNLAQKYMVRAIPTSFFLDKEGIIRAKHTGSLTETMLENAINEAKNTKGD